MAKVQINLGERDDVAALYSFPNNPSEFILPKQTLSGTIEHFLGHSLKRDGYNATVTANDSGGTVTVTIDGPGADEYKSMLPSYLKAGRLGLQGVRKLADNDRYFRRYNWRFFLPHGVPMVRHNTVQLLHFPPDTVLMRDRNYLTAATTERWAELLKANGVPPDETDRFQNIIDIAPIAAPHKDGKLLEGSYSHFDGYIKALMNLWLPRPGQAGIRPMVAFGKPVREWLEAKYDVEFGSEVPALGTVTLNGGHEVPTLSTNHPSYIWAAVRYLKDNPFTPQDEPLGPAMKIMQQDIIAACWQVNMIKNPRSNPVDILSDAKSKWDGREQELCKLTYKQVWSKSDQVAECLAGALLPGEAKSLVCAVSDEEIEASRHVIGADEASVEPEDFVPQ